MTETRRIKKTYVLLCDECGRGIRRQWPDREKVGHRFCVSCIREKAVIELAQQEAGEFLRAGGTLS